MPNYNKYIGKWLPVWNFKIYIWSFFKPVTLISEFEIVYSEEMEINIYASQSNFTVNPFEK